MAAKKQNQTQTRKNNKGKSANKPQTKKERSAKEQDQESVSHASEIIVWIISGLMILIELGNFGLCGFVRYISNVFFGVFGILEYIIPVTILFAAFFLFINEYKKRAIHKVIFALLVLLCFGVMIQMGEGIDSYHFKTMFMEGYYNHHGGGILAGSIAYLLNTLLGSVGTYIIIVFTGIICVVLLAEISVIDFLKDIVTSKDTEEDDEEMEEEEDEDETGGFHPATPDRKHGISKHSFHTAKKEQRSSKAKNKRAEKKQTAILLEDYPEQPKNGKKKSSMLDAISVLPPDTDQGILPSVAAEKVPQKEEIHEIKMDYVLNLPGEHMENITVTSDSKNNLKHSDYADKKDEKRTPSPIVQTQDSFDSKAASIAQSENQFNTQIIQPLAQTESAVKSDNTKQMELENKTAAVEKTLSAKEIGDSDANYRFPPLELLKKSKSQAAEKVESVRLNAIKLQEVLKSFGVNVSMTNFSCGPSVTRYEMVPEQGTKVSKITGLADDIMMNLAAQSIRIEAPIPGKSAVGIEIPNGKRSPVGFRELIDTEKFKNHPSKIAVAVGKDIEGSVVVEDIAKMPHLLIAGATGSGKSVCTNTLIMSILYKARPDEVKLILIDPKQVELKVYNGIPHLLTPVVTDPKKAAGALNWAVVEMTKRYEMFSECNVRNIQGYNAKVEEAIKSGKTDEEKLEKMPQIVIIVDELADLMMVAKAEVEEAIVRLAQLARAAGIHLVIATQRPSVDVVTGLIKANVPSRIALSVSSGVDSRTIIDSVGAEKLLGNGDMLFYPTMYPKPLRVQGAYISDEEVMKVVEFLKTQNGETVYSEEVTNQIAASSSGTSTVIDNPASDDRDEYFVQAARFIIEKNKASIGMLQRMYKIGFNRAARIMDQLYDAGVVGPEEGTKPRQVLMSEEEFEEYIDEYI